MREPGPAVVLKLLRGAFLVFPFMAAAFWLATPLGFWGALYLAFLMELLPALALAQLPLVDEDAPLPRIPVYLSSAAVILLVGAGALLVGKREVGIVAMGLGPADPALVTAWSVGLTLGALFLLAVFLYLRRHFRIRETTLLARLIPVTRREKGVFVLLSLSAGLGEELAYRGFLVPVLSPLLGGAWPAAVLASAVFGLLHAYQGWIGVFRTGILGFILALSMVLSGTLWPAILAHAILDVMAGVVLGRLLLKE
jgi:membrane protease YdiL (CAAX protease family)